ncbi:hypothetical protein TNCV_1201561 [Trichonephila clavipes]|nr:hypothetical protein TNCV_1201561 [Trichonephila clavipes]
MVQNYLVRRQKLRVAEQCDVNIHSLTRLSSRATKDPPCRGAKCTLSREQARRSPFVWYGSSKTQVPSSSFDHSSTLRGPSLIVLTSLYSWTLISPHLRAKRYVL